MFETNKLTPVYNGYQFLFICIVAIVLDMIVHFFSSRKYYSVTKTHADVFGFAPELMIYYRSLSKKGPLPTDGGPDSFYASCNSWLIAALIAGTTSIIVLLLTDIILQIIDYRNTV